jgi:hypothetical protein
VPPELADHCDFDTAIVAAQGALSADTRLRHLTQFGGSRLSSPRSSAACRSVPLRRLRALGRRDPNRAGDNQESRDTIWVRGDLPAARRRGIADEDIVHALAVSDRITGTCYTAVLTGREFGVVGGCTPADPLPLDHAGEPPRRQARSLPSCPSTPGRGGSRGGDVDDRRSARVLCTRAPAPETHRSRRSGPPAPARTTAGKECCSPLTRKGAGSRVPCPERRPSADMIVARITPAERGVDDNARDTPLAVRTDQE